jgi:hypothetical protein
MSDAHDKETPGDPGIILGKDGQVFPDDSKWSKRTCTEMKDNILYMEAIGSLLYLMMTSRPDIAYTVSLLSRYMQKPMEDHWTAVKRIFKYLKGTRDYCLTYGQGDTRLKNETLVKNKHLISNLEPYGFADADFARDVDTRQSTLGWCYMLNGAAISWGSKKTQLQATSSSQAEYYALGQAANEGIWLREFLTELGLPMQNSIVIYEDNKAAIDLSMTPKYHGRTKHIEIQHHYLRSLVNYEYIKIVKVPTKDNTADIFTKPLGKILHKKFTDELGMTKGI